MRRSILWLAAAVALLATATPALATPVATNDVAYAALGRVFPDPLAGCQLAGTSPCSPNAQGKAPATQFIQYPEFIDALRFMNSKPEWARYMEVLVLDGKLGDGSGTAGGNAMFPGNNLPFLEWTPKPEYVSAGLPTSTLDRKRSDLIVVRVTDETVPDAGKKRYTLALSIHGIERAGLEGGTRAMEDIATAHTTAKHDDPILPAAAKAGAPTFEQVLDKTIIYFTYPNPDGWRRGDVSELGVFYQRYNGNGVDLNRDWPDIGYTFRPYSGGSEPETRAFLGFYDGVRAKTGSGFAAGDDLHGMPGADALSYTMLPHGRHDYGKDLRLRETAKTINRATYHAVNWSPIIQSNDKPAGTCAGTSVATLCGPIYGQTWGTVYDTINYTTTGTLGDWFDSRVGLNSDGIDNEMAFSHLDRNIVFDPHGEQMHVDGNKALIYAHLADIVAPPAAPLFNAGAAKGYVPNLRLVREEQVLQEDPRKKYQPQPDYDGLSGSADPAEDGQIVVPFKVYERKHKGKVPGISNGGMRVDVTTTNAQGIANAFVTLKVQCYGCRDDHAGAEEEGWVTVAEDFDQSEIYLQSGITAAVNRPHGSPDGVPWRALISPGTLEARVDVHFTSGPATSDGTTGGDEAPRLAGYDVANTDFFVDLNRFIADPAKKFQPVDPRKVIAGEQSLAGLESLVLADNALPGYTGLYDDERHPTGPPTANISFEETKPTTPGDGLAPGCRAEASIDRQPEFTIGENDGNASMEVRIEWGTPAFDWDLFVQRKNAAGGYDSVGSSTSFNVLTGQASERVVVRNPVPGTYRIEVVNCSAVDPNYTGTVTFQPLPPPSEGTGAYTVAEKDAWFAKLQAYVESGGNVVLTDGALRALQELTPIAGTAVTKQTVYAGQMTFAKGSRSTDSTLGDPLNANVKQDGARFNTGMRRQIYEPTPLGFSIQDENGDDASGARQYDVDRAAWETGGGRTAATSADSGARNARPVYTRVTLGQLKVGAGTIRIAGALLPQPSTEHDHTLGVEPYAVTYTGYILVTNLVTP